MSNSYKNLSVKFSICRMCLWKSRLAVLLAMAASTLGTTEFMHQKAFADPWSWGGAPSQNWLHCYYSRRDNFKYSRKLGPTTTARGFLFKSQNNIRMTEWRHPRIQTWSLFVLENLISKPPFDLTHNSYASSFVSGIIEILLFEQRGQQLMMIAFFLCWSSDGCTTKKYFTK